LNPLPNLTWNAAIFCSNKMYSIESRVFINSLIFGKGFDIWFAPNKLENVIFAQIMLCIYWLFQNCKHEIIFLHRDKIPWLGSAILHLPSFGTWQHNKSNATHTQNVAHVTRFQGNVWNCHIKRIGSSMSPDYIARFLTFSTFLSDHNQIWLIPLVNDGQCD
jgi:hypothetical protein